MSNLSQDSSPAFWKAISLVSDSVQAMVGLCVESYRLSILLTLVIFAIVGFYESPLFDATNGSADSSFDASRKGATSTLEFTVVKRAGYLFFIDLFVDLKDPGSEAKVQAIAGSQNKDREGRQLATGLPVSLSMEIMKVEGESVVSITKISSFGQSIYGTVYEINRERIEKLITGIALEPGQYRVTLTSRSDVP